MVSQTKLFLQKILDSLSGNVTILDHKGNIALFNKNRVGFGIKNDFDPDFQWIGSNYIKAYLGSSYISVKKPKK